MSVLVTGAYGLLGAWLVGGLLERDLEIVVLRRDRPARTALELLGHAATVTVVDGDVRDGETVERALADFGVESVFHLAAQTLVGVARTAPAATFDTNVRGTWTVLEACRRTGVSRVIVASSDKAYGRHEELPYRETHELRGAYPYDASKAACDAIARSYATSFGLPVAVTRFANLYGGGDLHRSRLIPEAVCAALAGRPPVVRSDGSPERDFLYVEDAVAAYLAIWDALGRGQGVGEAFNAGGGVPYRVAEIVGTVCRLAGTDLAPDVRGTGVPAGEIDRQWVDTAKLTELTGWRPHVALEEGLARTIAWYRARPELW